MNKIKYFFQFIFVIVMFLIFKILGIKLGSLLGGKLFQTIGSMGELIQKEKKFYESNMAKKERTLTAMEGDFRDLINSFSS